MYLLFLYRDDKASGTSENIWKPIHQDFNFRKNHVLGILKIYCFHCGSCSNRKVFVWCSARNNVQKPVKCPQSIPKLNYFSLVFDTILLYLCLTLYRIKMLLP